MALTIGMVTNIKLKIHTLMWQFFPHFFYLGTITELIVEICGNRGDHGIL